MTKEAGLLSNARERVGDTYKALRSVSRKHRLKKVDARRDILSPGWRERPLRSIMDDVPQGLTRNQKLLRVGGAAALGAGGYTLGDQAADHQKLIQYR